MNASRCSISILFICIAINLRTIYNISPLMPLLFKQGQWGNEVGTLFNAGQKYNFSNETAPQCSQECEFLLRSHHDLQNLPNGSFPKIVKISNESQFGRSGNSIRSMFNAMTVAYLCKSALELPSTDSYGTFHFQEHLFDFTQRPGETSADFRCEQGEFVRTNREFFYIFNNTHVTVHAEVLNKLKNCMRHFLGICVQGLCADHRAAKDGVLVVHLRQGDIYPPNYSPKVHQLYQQPSLAYYSSIINFTKSEKVILVGEDKNHGPVWDAFEIMHSFGLTKFDIEFQSSNLREDMLTMLCAQKFVESKSTMMSVIRLGFAVQIFTHQRSCLQTKAQEVYFVDSGQFDNGRHSNSAEEWVAKLLEVGNVSPPRLCRTD